MPKVTLKPNPTFRKKVEIATPDGLLEIEVEFKHKTKEQLAQFAEASKSRDDIDTVLDIVGNWFVDEPFTRERVQEFLDDFHAASRTLVERYYLELSQVRLGN